MTASLDPASVVHAFSEVGVNLTLQEEFDENIPMVGAVHTAVFAGREPKRLLKLSVADQGLVLIVNDESEKHRAVYDLERRCGSSFGAFLEGIRGKPEMIATLKGADVIDTPIDWDGYK